MSNEPYDDGVPYIRLWAGPNGMFEDETGQGFNLSGIASEANARLIATAPELYEANAEVLDTLIQLRADLVEENAALHAQRIAVIDLEIERLSAALAKARGEQA